MSKLRKRPIEEEAQHNWEKEQRKETKKIEQMKNIKEITENIPENVTDNIKSSTAKLI